MPRGEALQIETQAAMLPALREDVDALSRVAMERAPIPMFVADAADEAFPIVLANPAFLEMSGYDAEEVLGRDCMFLQGEATPSGAIEHLRRSVRNGRATQVELLAYRKTGEAPWTVFEVSPIRSQEGRIRYVFGSVRDVSDRREAAAFRDAERRLLREVDHRAMNALALVQGFVRLSRRDSIEVFARSVQGRVDVLARTHALLARTRWADVTLERLLQMELDGSTRTRAQLRGPTVLVAAERVQPLALLIHELADNAARHGALSAPDGRLEIAWRPSRRPEMVTLLWRESGAHAARPPAGGFGLKLISSIARQQLRGQIRQRWADSGLTTVLRCRILPSG